MSADLYQKWWILTKSQLADLQKYDRFMKKSVKPTKERLRAGYLVSGLYCKYCMIVQDIDTCLDQIAQAQKSYTIRKLMDCAVMRLNEFKEMLTNIDLSEIHYVDGALIELKLVPFNIEILDPALLFPRPDNIEEMLEKIQRGERLFERPKPPTPPPETINELDLLLRPRATVIPPEASPLPPADESVASESIAEEGTTEIQTGEMEQEQAKGGRKKKFKGPKKFVLEKKELTEQEKEALKLKEKITNTVKLIQNHERARQARVYVLDQSIFKKKTRRAISDKQKDPDPELVHEAVRGFQKLWRGFATRHSMKLREDKRRLIIGMTEPSWKSKEEFEKLQRIVDKRKELVNQHRREYFKALLDEKARVLRVVSPGLMEDIGDEIREWFYQWYIRARNFDKYPSVEKGGTILVVRGETMTPEEWLDDVEKKRRQKLLDTAKGGKDKAKEKAAKKKKEMEQKKRAAEKKRKEAEERKRKERNLEFEFKFEDSVADRKMEDTFKEYNKLWGSRKLIDNPTDELYMDIITDEKCYEVQLECRAKVDELMRLELELLKTALDYDKAKAKGKKPKAKKKKKKKKRKRSRKGKKGKKDPTSKRSTEDLFQELVDAGIIHTYPATHLSDFKGDFSYNNFEKRQQEYDPPAALGDLRQVIALTCILPLGTESMAKPRSVLIIGHKKCGKHLLANAIFTETKCVLFDLSAPILAGQYPGTAGMKMLVHLVNKMSRLLQPSVIFFDGAEKPFYKKVPKQEKELQPKRIGAYIFKKVVKAITPDDRVLVLGISHQPWVAKAKGLKKAYERVILIPRTDYGSIYLYWRELLMPYHALDRNIDLSCLARLSVHYPLCQLKEIVETVMTPRRIIQLRYNPLHQTELFELLIKRGFGPVSDKEYKKFIKYYNKTTWGRRKAKYMVVVEKIREAEAKAAAKAAEQAARNKPRR